MSKNDDNITFNDLCKSCDIIIPEILLNALEAKYTPEECVILLSKTILTNNNLRVINPTLIDKYIKSKNKNGLIKFR